MKVYVEWCTTERHSAEVEIEFEDLMERSIDEVVAERLPEIEGGGTFDACEDRDVQEIREVVPVAA